MVATFKRECLDPPTPKGQLVQVPFHGDVLEAWGTCVADAEVSIRRVCENLGISAQGQMKKLQAKKWGCINLRLMQVEGDTQSREVATIPLKRLPMWLANIDPRRVKEQFRAKLERYQEEAADALARHFLTPAASTVTLTAEQFDRLVGRVEHLQQQLDRLTAAPPPMLTPATPRYTLRERLRWHGWASCPRGMRRAITKHVKDLIEKFCDDVPHQAGGTAGGGPLVFQGGQLIYLDEAILHYRACAERARLADEQRQPTLPFPKDAVNSAA